jgi:hypothetical protein
MSLNEFNPHKSVIMFNTPFAAQANSNSALHIGQSPNKISFINTNITPLAKKSQFVISNSQKLEFQTNHTPIRKITFKKPGESISVAVPLQKKSFI